MANSLAQSTCPYLVQHAENPVNWWEWSEAAFAEARRRDMPIFLVIGYSACRWCHVMDRTLRIWLEIIKSQVKGTILDHSGSAMAAV